MRLVWEMGEARIRVGLLPPCYELWMGLEFLKGTPDNCFSSCFMVNLTCHFQFHFVSFDFDSEGQMYQSGSIKEKKSQL